MRLVTRSLLAFLLPAALVLPGCGDKGADTASGGGGDDGAGSTTEPEGTNPGECSDGADNDGDGDFDCNDSDCAGSPDCSEASSPGGCSDGADNDQDGLFDCDDPDCTGYEECLAEDDDEGTDACECTDGLDNDGDGLVDCDDEGCAEWPECAPSTPCGSIVLGDGEGVVFDELFNIAANYSTFTVEAWVRWDGGADGNYLTALRQVSSSGESGYDMFLGVVARSNDSACPTTPGMLRVFNNGTSEPYCLSATDSIGSDDWHHVAYQYDGTTMSFYLDGRSAGSGPIGFGLPSYTGLVLGGRGSEVWHGSLGPVRVSEGLRYASGFVPDVLGQDDATVALFPFSEGAGTTTTELVSSSEGTLLGGSWSSECPPPYEE